MTENVGNTVPIEFWKSLVSRDSDDKAPRRPSREGASGSEGNQAREEGPYKKEWASTLVLVQEASEAIKASEDRVVALEHELELAAVQRRDDQRQMSSRLQAARDEIQAANARAKELEARALEAEGWLARLHDAIAAGFGPSSRETSTDIR